MTSPPEERVDEVALMAGAPSARSRRHLDFCYAFGAALFAAGVAVLISRTTFDSPDSTMMSRVAIALVNHLSVAISDPNFRSHYSYYGIGMSLFMIPAVAVAKLLGASQTVAALLTNAWLIPALTVAIYAWTRLRGYSRDVSLMVSLAVALGGGYTVLASSGLSEVALGLCIAVCLIGVTAAQQGRNWSAIAVGIGIGGAVLVRDDSVILVVPWVLGGALLAWRRDVVRQRLAAVAASGLPLFVIWLEYNWIRFRSPLGFGYGGWLVFDHSFVKGLYGLVLSPGIGVCIYVPLVFVAAAGVPAAWRRDRIMVVIAIGLIVGRVCFYAPFWGWWGGLWGPRFLFPAMVALAVGVAPVFERFAVRRRLAQVVVAGLVAASAGFSFIGGAVSNYANPVVLGIHHPLDLEVARLHISSAEDAVSFYVQSRYYRDLTDRVEFDWHRMPLEAEARALVHLDPMISAALSRPPDYLRLALAGDLVATGTVALLVGRWLGRRSPLPPVPE